MGDPVHPSFVVNWTLYALCQSAYVGLSVYTQTHLILMKRAKENIAVLDHPHYVTALLINIFFYPFVLLLQYGAGVPLPCAATIFIPHVIAGGMVAVLMYRYMSFILRLARIEIAQHVLKRGTALSDAFSMANKKTPISRNEKMAHKILNHLSSDGIMVICVVTFVIECVAFPFLLRENRKWAAGKDDVECEMLTSGFVVPLYLIWALVIMYLIRGFTSVDRFYIAWKIKVQAGAALAVLIVSIILFLAFRVQSKHWRFGLHIFWIVQMLFWYTESWTPLKVSREWRDISGATEGKGKRLIRLVQTLSDPDLLRRFEGHVLKEWAPESLQFFKAVTVHEIFAKKALTAMVREAEKEGPNHQTIERITSDLLIGAIKIFQTYVDTGAHYSININGSKRQRIVNFFSSSSMIPYRVAAETCNKTFETLIFKRSSRRLRSPTWRTMRRNSHRQHSPRQHSPMELSSPSPRSPSPATKSDDAKSDDSPRTPPKRHHSFLESEMKSRPRPKRMSGTALKPLDPYLFCKIVSEANFDLNYGDETGSDGISDGGGERKSEKSDLKSVWKSDGSGDIGTPRTGSVTLINRMKAISDTASINIELLLGVINIFSEAAREVFQLMEGDTHARFTVKESVVKLATYDV
mmetsp:Transcript_27694/g.53845  ORF Transcript_27694/g.53845 Transcript_27694/m.53845 type:complete len:637 (+) Transcript_27694:54-1964(+)